MLSRFNAVLVLAGLIALEVAALEPRQLTPRGQPGRPLRQRPVPGGSSTLPSQLSDADALKKAGLDETDGRKLIAYLQTRTLTEKEQDRIGAIVKRFGADDFEERVRATEEIVSFGPAAIGPLNAAANSPDAEVAFRARQALTKIETVPHTAVAAAAVRAVLKLKPEGAAAALIGFLPLADDEPVADAIRHALVSFAVAKDGQAEPALVAALADHSPIRRAAAYVALIEGGPTGERIHIPDAYSKVREAVLRDADTEARFVGLWALTLTTREKDYLPELLALIPKLSRGHIWQLEDLLLQIAGTHPQGGRFLKSPESLMKARDAWLAWWKEKGEAIDLVKLDYIQRVAGFTDVLELDVSFGAAGRLTSLGPDMKERWRITGLNSPTDMRIAENGHVFVVESNSDRITERTTTNRILNTLLAHNQPVNLELLPDGGKLVVCRNNVYTFDRAGKQVWRYQRTVANNPNVYDIHTGHLLPNGDTLIVTNNGQARATAIRLDAKLKPTGKTYSFGNIYYQQVMSVAGAEKVLVCEVDKVAEYDLKTGKQIWKHSCSNASSCQRLINGNTLICLINMAPRGKVIEVDPSGEIVWEYEGKDGLRPGRAYRR